MSGLPRIRAALTLVLLLGACEYIGENNYKPKSEVIGRFQDRTVLYYGGWRLVVYYAADGQAYFWPGRSQSIIRGQWKLDETSSSNRICTRHEPYKYDPITGVDYSQWRCVLLSYDESYTMDEAPGDPLDLRRRLTTPFTFQSVSHDTIDEIRKSLPALP